VSEKFSGIINKITRHGHNFWRKSREEARRALTSQGIATYFLQPKSKTIKRARIICAIVKSRQNLIAKLISPSHNEFVHNFSHLKAAAASFAAPPTLLREWHTSFYYKRGDPNL
jgi:hypothetical protein